MKVRFTLPARADLEQIYAYIAKRNPAAAQRVEAQIWTDAELLGDFPFIARSTDAPELRVKKVRRYPYLIFYTMRSQEILILHVRHAARQWPWEDDQ